MKELIYEAGYLITYLLCELDKIKEIDPILCKFDFKNNKTTKEFRGIIDDSIPKILEAYEDSEKDSAKAIAIFPAEIVEDGKRFSSLILMAKNFITEQKLVVFFPYEFNNDKVYVSSYEVIESINLDVEELKNLNLYFLKGALSFQNGIYIWQERFVKEDSLV
jgi:hypothetical protein